MSDALDPIHLLRLLHERGVEHIVVGSFAVTAHGFTRMTKGLDTVPNPTEGNLTKLSQALLDLEATSLDAGGFTSPDPPRQADLAQGGNFYLHTHLGRLDIMQWVSGIDADDPYAELNREALAGTVDDVPVRVCGLGHLRAMKRAAGRPLDLEDLARLGED